MRTLLILRGLPGAGKSTWVEEVKSKYNTAGVSIISPDEYRSRIVGCNYDIEGRKSISMRLDRLVWDRVWQDIELAMQEGLFIIVDATNWSDSNYPKYKKLKEKYKYNIFCKTFDTRLDICVERCAKRDYNYIGQNAIWDMHSRRYNTPTWVRDIDTIEEILGIPEFDASRYHDVVFIGDLHGEYDKFIKHFNYAPNVLYVFVGDWFDGYDIEQEKLLYKEVLLKYYDAPNVILIEGNHDRHLGEVYRGSPKNTEFYRWLNANQVELKLSQVWRRFKQAAIVKFNDKKYFITHGGININHSSVLTPQFIPIRNFLWGFGEHKEDIAAKDSKYGYINVHGHRVASRTPYNIALENGVKTKGSIVMYSVKHGYTDIPVDNSAIARLKTLASHPHIKHNKLNYEGDVIHTFNFTRTAFRKKIWDDTNLKTRDLFMDSNANVVIRGFDKFFNVEEECGYTALQIIHNWSYPVKVTKKYNGFLGLLSVYKGQFIFASKTQLDSFHSNLFFKLFYKLIPLHYIDKLFDILSKENCTALFEVCSPEDPHVIDEGTKIVFLGTVKNSFEEATILNSREEEFDILQPETFYIEEPQAMANFLQESVKLENIEGFVLRDSDGRMAKIKTNDYLNKKRLRKLGGEDLLDTPESSD